MNLVLIGFRGTGKTTVGKKLAQRLGLGYIDTDESLEDTCGISIKEFVEKFGWREFRRKEKEVVKGLFPLDGYVIAAGGGVVLDEENIRNLKRNGRTILLTADPETILDRLRKDPLTGGRRPPLSRDLWEREIRDLIQMRTPSYLNSADYVIETTQLGVEEVVEVIIQWWEGLK
ncbi:MAG: shikimate kinase [Deltaproteobacteria bacterium]|nr:shikimate kinase [Deltaproteobacteria bacterium]